MNVAIILAGGVGSRVGSKTPKQYIEVEKKPIIVYTLEKFQASQFIDAIEVVCASEYKEYVKKLGSDYGISKLKWVVDGGDTCQSSIRCGVYALTDKCSTNDNILIHMSVSPMIADVTIEQAIKKTEEKGNAFAVQPCIFCMCKKVNPEWSDQNAYKEDYLIVNMPWTMKFQELHSIYQEAEQKHIGMDSKSYLPSLMFDLGKKIYLFPDNDLNRLKITTKGDIQLFKALLLLQKSKKE